MKARLQILSEASVAFADATADPDRLAVVIAQKLTETFADSCGVVLLDEGTDILRHAAFVHRNPEAQELVGRMLRDSPLRFGQGLMGSVARSQQPLLVPEVNFEELVRSTKPEYQSIVRRFPAHSLLVVPLTAHGRTFGVLGLARADTPGAYTEDDLRLAEDLAERAAMSVELSQLLERERETSRRALALADASKAIQTLDYKRALSTLVRLAADLVGDACIATLLEDGILKTEVAAHRNADAAQQMQRIVGEALPQDTGLPAQVLRENRAIRLEDAESYESSMRSVDEYKAKIGWASILICPIRIEGKAVGTLGASRDRGGRRYTVADELYLQDLADRAALVIQNARLYELAQAARKEAETASSQKDEFLSVASHELRTPITTVQLMIQTALSQVKKLAPDPIASDWLLPRLEKANRQAHRLVSLIDGLMDVSRLGAEKLMLEPETIDLAELAESVIARFEDHAAQAGCSITLESHRPVVGCWDRERLDQVITNLLTNALKYGRGRPIVIKLVELDRTAAISVVDQGIGVATEHHQRIFERFERAESVRHYGGFGVGLWIVREVVRAMGGAVRVESEQGRGATFTVEVPR